MYRFGRYTVDPEKHEITAEGDAVSVQPQVFALLVFLIENRDRVVTKDEIFGSVWHGRIVSDSTLNARINAARRALGDDGGQQAVIRTFPRRGFRFVADITEDAGTVATPQDNDDEDRPALVVLPFRNVSTAADQDFLAEGITADIVTALSKLRGFFVVGHSTAATYRDTENAAEISADLGVRYVVQGSVQTAGSRVRVTAQLTEAASGAQLWAERYDRDLTDIFAVQDEVTASVVGCLAPELYSAEHARLQRRPPQNLDAWACFVRGMHEYSRQSKESSARALDLLERAIELDGGYAQALGLYAITLSWRVIQRWEPYEASLARAVAAAERAVVADANDPWANMGRGMVAMVARDSETAIINFGRAVALSPNFAYAHAMLGAATAYSGDGDKALHHVDTAIRLSPRDTFIDKFYVYQSLAHFQAARYADAAAAAHQAIQIKPEHANSHMLAAASYALAGEEELAARALDAFTTLVPETTAANVERAIAFRDPAVRARVAEGLRRAGLKG